MFIMQNANWRTRNGAVLGIRQQLIIPLASFPGPARLSVACMQYGKSDGKLGGAWEQYYYPLIPGPVKLHNNSPLPTHTLTHTLSHTHSHTHTLQNWGSLVPVLSRKFFTKPSSNCLLLTRAPVVLGTRDQGNHLLPDFFLICQGKQATYHFIL